MFTPEQIYENIEKRLEILKLSDRQFMVDAGLKRGVLDSLKNGSMPSGDKLALIADFFDISLDSLVGRTLPDTAPADMLETPRKESELIDILSQMHPDDVKAVKAVAETLRDARAGRK